MFQCRTPLQVTFQTKVHHRFVFRNPTSSTAAVWIGWEAQQGALAHLQTIGETAYRRRYGPLAGAAVCIDHVLPLWRSLLSLDHGALFEARYAPDAFWFHSNDDEQSNILPRTCHAVSLRVLVTNKYPYYIMKSPSPERAFGSDVLFSSRTDIRKPKSKRAKPHITSRLQTLVGCPVLKRTYPANVLRDHTGPLFRLHSGARLVQHDNRDGHNRIVLPWEVRRTFREGTLGIAVLSFQVKFATRQVDPDISHVRARSLSTFVYAEEMVKCSSTSLDYTAYVYWMHHRNRFRIRLGCWERSGYDRRHPRTKTPSWTSRTSISEMMSEPTSKVAYQGPLSSRTTIAHVENMLE